MSVEQKAYGSITIIDVGDVGTLSVYPESNLPTQIVYNPDTGAYIPDWMSTPLTLTANIMYGANVPTNNYVINWTSKKLYENGTSANGDSNLNQTTKTWRIDKNIFNDTGETTLRSITYTCTVIYTDPETGAVLTAAG